jgi:hypothetical protein
MHTKRGIKRSRRAGALVGAVGTLAGAMVGSASHADGSVINVAMANFSTTTSNTDASAFGSNNHGITPINYSVPTVTIPLGSHPTDAAAPDTGTQWNSLQAVSTNLATAVTATSYILYEQNLALVDSNGNPTGVTMDVYPRLPSGKLDAFHISSNVSVGAGSDGLAPSPVNSTDPTNSTNDGYSGSSNNSELMGSEWISGGTAEGFAFTLFGLTPNGVYDLYVYGAGCTANASGGQGGRFEGTSTILTDANGNTTGGTLNATNATTNSVLGAENRSVFDASNNSATEQGLSWNELVLTADANGDLSFTEDRSSEASGGVKPALNGFQLVAVVPEPTSVLLLAVGGIGLLGRRRSRT